ncbi:MAG: hypothetical protein JWN26_50 [Candidatus Saccharibacteria bacterium]|nr:hypothetical protein [Candidatus Saccharibacteria bacterium]
MNKVITKTKKPVKNTTKASNKVNAKKKIISKPTKIILAALTLVTIGVCTFAVINNSYAKGGPNNGVPISSSAEAEISNVTVDVSAGNSVRVQFDYVLANGATQALVDAALNYQQSFGAVLVTGPGHYDQTISNAADGTYFIELLISGNPAYILGDPGPSNQPLVVTLPDTTSQSNGGHNILHVEKFFHKQK